jgi:UDP-N-acetylglucosamine--N-acetylmuramyl-(pentapeptide) pyrophosphoryl-undecaprenol N-acetylglucosamine transferase
LDIRNPKSEIRNWKLVLAAGGTGGHISPALAIADHLARVEPACRIEFVCGARPVEVEVYRRAGVTPKVMDVAQLVPGWRGLLSNVLNFRRALKATREYLRADLPRVVVGMGGYVCYPAVSAAAGEGIPTMIHEQNAVAGRANRWLSQRVTAIACAYPQAAAAFPREKTRVTGNPVRPEFVGGDRAAGLRHWGLESDIPTLLISGGSQGARRLNQIILDALNSLDQAAAELGGLQLLWSGGEKNFEELNEALKKTACRRIAVRLLPFIREMGLAYAVADLALCRAGAMTLSELTANGVPAILVPLPEAIADHQRLNAQPLVEAGAAVVLDERELNGQRLADELSRLFFDRPGLEKMQQASRQWGRPQAVEEIVAMILQLRGELS